MKMDMKPTGKLIITAFCAILFALSCTGTPDPYKNMNPEKKVLKQSEELIALRKYESAFILLSNFEPQSGAVIAMQIDISINFFITSMMHKMFALKDLEPEEDLMILRKNGGSYAMHTFDPELYSELAADNPELARALGDYYYDSYYRYGDDWVYKIPETLEKANFFYRTAREGGVFNYMTLANEAHFLLQTNKNEEAVKLLDQSIALKSDYPTNHFNKAYALAAMELYPEAIDEALTAINLYQQPDLKYDAIIMATKLCIHTGQFETAEAILLNSIIEFPEASDPVYYLIYLYLLEHKFEQAAEVSFATFKSFSTYPSVAAMILDAYVEAGYPEFYLPVIEAMLSVFNDDQTLGNLYFHRSIAYLTMKDAKNSKKDLLKARKHFSNVFESDHQVFTAIKNMLKDLD